MVNVAVFEASTRRLPLASTNGGVVARIARTKIDSRIPSETSQPIIWSRAGRTGRSQGDDADFVADAQV